METDWCFVRRITDLITTSGLLDPLAAKDLAIHIVDGLEVQAETHTISGGKYLGPVEISRWVTAYFKR